VSGIAQSTDGSALQGQVRQLVNPDQTQNVQDSVVAYVRARVTGDQQAADKARDQAVNGVAQTAKISPDEARTRVDQLVQQAQQVADQARQRAAQAAETARKGVGSAALVGFLALVHRFHETTHIKRLHRVCRSRYGWWVPC
jgi:CHASE3 domain sensor protein